LREVRVSDVNDNYYRWMNDPEITQYLESRFYPNSMESLQKYVKRKLGNPDEIFLAIINKERDFHIGNIKIGPINWIHRVAEVGILIGDKTSWGKGYGTEAIGLVVKYAFNILNLHKLTAGCYNSNQGSLKAFQKNGFEIEGIRKKHNFHNGKYIDAILLGLLNPNWGK